MGRPLSGNHEFITAMGLRHLEIWDEVGAVESRFLPIATYPGAANRYISNHAVYDDGEGRYYYVSLPPFGYIAPYLAISALGGSPDVLPIQRFNVAVQLVTAFGLFWLVKILTRPRSVGEYVPATLAFLLYAFSAETLWFHSNVYLSEMLVQMFFAWALVAFASYVSNPARKRALWALGALVFLGVYTEWLMTLVAGSFFAFAFVHRDKQVGKRLMAMTAGSASLGIATYLAHYSIISGIVPLFKALGDRTLERGGLTAASRYSILDPEAWGWILRHYFVTGYRAWMLVLIGLTLAVFLATRRASANGAPLSRGLIRSVILVATAPVVIHHLLLIDFSAIHSYAVLKGAVPLSVLVGLLAYRLLDSVKIDPAVWKTAVTCLAFATVSAMFVSYVDYGSLSTHGATPVYRNVGEAIASRVEPDEVAFYDAEEVAPLRPQLIVYARRNLASWVDTETAQALLARTGVDRGVVFGSDEAGRLVTRRFGATD